MYHQSNSIIIVIIFFLSFEIFQTKRMVIEKMADVVQGSPAMKNLDPSSTVNLEENVLIAGFCDLLERIWSHGLHHKPNGKSALWNHLKCYVKLKQYESAQVSHEGIPLNLSKDENPGPSTRRSARRSENLSSFQL